jgi:heptosyltransferase-1
MAGKRVLIVKLGAMGDVIHTLPAARALAPVTWLVKPQWLPLLEGNPHVRAIVSLESIFDEAYDFQGLIKSAIFARFSGAKTIRGFDDPRESPARWFYTHRVARRGEHVVDHNLALAGVAGPAEFTIPPGRPEGRLPEGKFVLACPLAGWVSKQWPREYYEDLRRLLPVPLVLNGPPGSGLDHESSIAGLIDATRRAAAIVGVDSGPLHLAAALAKPGVAIFGPTDPKRNGPYGGTMCVLRHPGAPTNYKRGTEISPSMRAIAPKSVARAIEEFL